MKLFVTLVVALILLTVESVVVHLLGLAIALFLVCVQAIFLGPTEDQILLTKHSIHLTSPGGVTDHGPIFPDDGALGKSAFLGRRQNVAIEARTFSRNILFVDERLQVRAKLGAI